VLANLDLLSSSAPGDYIGVFTHASWPMKSNNSLKIRILLLLSVAIGSAHADLNVDALVTLKTDVLVPSRTAAAIGQLHVQEGDLVEKNQLIATLDATLAEGDFRAAAREAEVYRIQKDNDIDIRLSQKNRDVSQRELRRSQQANDRFAKAVSSTELERLQMMVEQANLSEEKARLELQVLGASYELKQTITESTQERIDMHKIVSPIKGMVVATRANQGEWLDIGQSVVRVIQLDVLRVEANIDGTKHGEELLGKEISFSTNYNDETQTYSGQSVFISPEVDPVDGMVRVWADIENKKRTLKPGMRGVLTIPTSE